MPRATVRLLGSVVVGLLAVALLPVLPATAQDGPEPMRILLVGDSITEGSAGDYTWRYRLARHLEAHDCATDLVGPHTAMIDPVTQLHDSTTYADPDFDQDHFAKWGGSFRATSQQPATTEDSIGWAVSTYQPDVVVELLGVNDLTYWTSPQETLSLAHDFVDDVRAARPDTQIVASTVPNGWNTNVPAYDDLLRAQAPTWSTTSSPVVVADPMTGWDMAADSYDSTHPNANGEIEIAAAVEDALSTLGVCAPADRPLGTVPLGPRAPASLSAAAGDGQATLSWVGPPGATAEYVWGHDVTAHEPWSRLPFGFPDSPFVAHLLTNGDHYEFRLQAAKGTAVADDLYSNVVDVVPGPAEPPVQPPGQPPAGPTPAPTPAVVTGVLAVPGSHSVALSWRAQSTATSYAVSCWPAGHPSAVRRTTVVSSRVVLHSLQAGLHYVVSLTASGAGGRGPASPAIGVVPRGARPSAPTLTRARIVHGHVRASWRPARYATRYEVLVRRPGRRAWSVAGWTTGNALLTRVTPRHGAAAVRVRAWDQYVPGGLSAVRHVRIR